MRAIRQIYLLFTACVAWLKSATRYLAAIAVTCFAMLGGRAEACMVCIPFPEDTATDQLLQADVVVRARENPDKPFSYLAILGSICSSTARLADGWPSIPSNPCC